MLTEYTSRDLQDFRDSLLASELVYNIGGFSESLPDPEDLSPRLRRFLDRYRIVEPYADPDTGFKAIALEERNGSRRRIYAVAGVEFKSQFDISDVAAISAFAKPQLGGLRARDFIEDATRHARRAGDANLAGQSMGGLLAQTISYLVQRGLDDGAKGRVGLTTWGAVGGRELTDHVLKNRNETFDPEVMRKINAAGFFVDGDFFTRIGTHMEPTHMIPRPANVTPFDAHFIEKGIIPAIEASPKGLESAVPKIPKRDEDATRSFKRNLEGESSPIDIPVPLLRKSIGSDSSEKSEPEPERRTAVAFQSDTGGSETGGMLGDSMLVDPKDLSLENKDRVRARLGFHAEDAGRDPKKRKQVAKCMVDCFVGEPGFDGLPKGLDRQLGGIAATMSPDTALAVLREAVPEARQAEPPRRRNQPRKRQAAPAPLDEAGRKAVQQAVLNQGSKRLQTGIARGAVKKAVEGIGGKIMMGRDLPGIFGAAFAPMGGADKPMRAAAKTANAINERVGAPERADPADAGGRESATAIERAIQAAGPEKFTARLEDDPGFGFGGGGTSRAGRSLLDA